MFTLPQKGKVAKYCDGYICLFVHYYNQWSAYIFMDVRKCLPVHSYASKTIRSNFTICAFYLWPWHGPILWSVHYVGPTPNFVNDITFSHRPSGWPWGMSCVFLSSDKTRQACIIAEIPVIILLQDIEQQIPIMFNCVPGAKSDIYDCFVVYRSTEVIDCAENVVTEQCGAEIAGHLRAMGTKVREQFGCSTGKRQYSLYFHLFEYTYV